MFSLQNKIAVVTGGSSGIGKAIADLFAAQGAIVYVLDLKILLGGEIVNSIKTSNSKVRMMKCDVTNQQEATEVISMIIKQTGAIHILVNSAGIAHIGNIENTYEEDFERVFQINVKGVFNITKTVVTEMKRNGSGVILNIASVASSVGIADRFAYSMSKGAVLSMSLSVARDYIHYGIRCNCISPARIHTPFVDGFLKNNYPGKEEEMFEKLSKSQPIGRMGTPAEVASLALYLCSDEASFVTGCDYPLDGGFIRLNN